MPAKRVTNKHLLEELDALKQQVQSLEDQVQRHRPSTTQRMRADLLLAEYNRLSEFWRHTDSRMESTVNLYLTASAIVVTGLVYGSQQSGDLRTFLAVSVAAAAALFVGSIIVSRRILLSSVLKARYRYRLYLIRCHFMEFDESSLTPVASPMTLSAEADRRAHGGFSVRVSVPLLAAIYPWCSLLLGFIVGSTVWLAQPGLSPTFIIAWGMLIAISCFIVLWLASKRMIDREEQTSATHRESASRGVTHSPSE